MDCSCHRPVLLVTRRRPGHSGATTEETGERVSHDDDGGSCGIQAYGAGPERPGRTSAPAYPSVRRYDLAEIRLPSSTNRTIRGCAATPGTGARASTALTPSSSSRRSTTTACRPPSRTRSTTFTRSGGRSRSVRLVRRRRHRHLEQLKQVVTCLRMVPVVESVKIPFHTGVPR